MRTVALPFYSNGRRLDADLHLPDDDNHGAPYPVVIPASGYQGLKVIHPERFARALAPRGYAVLAFDYRGFGLSEGERGRLVPQEWAEDVRAAVDRVHGEPELDVSRIALLGWGLGGGVVVHEAADDDRVRAVVCCNGIGDGWRSTRSMHDEATWQHVLASVAQDRVARTTWGRSTTTVPWDIVRLDRDAVTDGYVGAELYQAPGFGSGVTWESADYLMRFSPESVVHKIAPRPLLVVHGEDNWLHRVEEAQSLYDKALEPKRLELLAGRGHTEWMFDENPTFRYVTDMIDAFLTDSLSGAPDRLPALAAAG